MGNARQYCEPPCSDIGCEAQWVDDDTCSGTCLALDDDAICVLSTTPEPRCKGKSTFCDGTVLVDCTQQFVSVRQDCASSDGPDAGDLARGRCVESGSSANCEGPQICCHPGVDLAACGAPSACGELVPAAWQPAPAPVATGGTILDGVYVLTGLITYGRTDRSLLPQVRGSWTVQSGVLTTAECWNDAPTFASGPFTVESNRLVFHPACSTSSSDGELPFSAVGAELLVYVAHDDGGTDQLTFTRQ